MVQVLIVQKYRFIKTYVKLMLYFRRYEIRPFSNSFMHNLACNSLNNDTDVRQNCNIIDDEPINVTSTSKI